MTPFEFGLIIVLGKHTYAVTLRPFYWRITIAPEDGQVVQFIQIGPLVISMQSTSYVR